MWVQSLGQEDALEKEMTTHTSILAWEIPWPEEPCGLQSMGSQRVNHWTHTHTHTHTANKGIHEWRWKGKGTVILGRPKRESTYIVLTSVFKALNQLASLLFRITDLKTSLSLFFRKGHQSPQSFFDSEAGGFLLYCAIEAEEEKQYIVKWSWKKPWNDIFHIFLIDWKLK